MFKLALDVTYRPGTLDDTPALFEVFLRAIIDLGDRLGSQAITGGDDPAVIAALRERRQPLMEHLASTASAFWVAEQDGRLVGYARAFLRERTLQLTEFFVSPEAQSNGIGRELLTRVFAPLGVERRVIIATLDARAQVLYLRSGVYPHFPISYFSRKPEANIVVANDLIFEPVTNTPRVLDIIGTIDQRVLGYRRDVDHQHLLTQRSAYLYRRKGEPVGYGYLGHNSGPFALLDDTDFPAVLAHAEREAALSGERFGVDVPLINRAAVDYLLARGCRMDSFMEFYMTDKLVGSFDRYIFTSPMYFT